MNTFDYSKCYKFNSKYELKRGKQDIYVNYNNGTILRTQAALTDILKHCDGNTRMDEIYMDMSKRYDIDSDLLKTSCKDVLLSAYNNKLIYEDEEPVEFGIELGCVNTIWVHLGSLCNLRCPFCYSESGSETQLSLEYDEIINFLGSIKNRQEISIIISGGEPFCYSKLHEFVISLRELEFKYIQLITNGTTGNVQYDKVIPLLDRIQFSLDGLTEEVNCLTRGVGSFDKTIQSIKLAKEYGAKYIIVSTLPTTYNLYQLKDLPEFMISLGVDAVHFPRFMPVGRGEAQRSIKPVKEQLDHELGLLYENLLKQQKNYRKTIHLSFAADWYSKIKSGSRRISCGAGSSTISINYDGYIYPCPSMHNEQFIIGHISKSFDSIMEKRDEMAYTLSVQNIDSSCFDCKNKYFCGGNCKAIALSYGNILERNEECDEIEYIIEKVLQEY